MLTPNEATDLLNAIAKEVCPESLLDFATNRTRPSCVTAYINIADEITIFINELGDSGPNIEELLKARHHAAIHRMIKVLEQSKIK